MGAADERHRLRLSLSGRAAEVTRPAPTPREPVHVGADLLHVNLVDVGVDVLAQLCGMLVRAPMTPHTNGLWPCSSFHGWKWSEIHSASNPAASARLAWSTSSLGPNCSLDRKYPILVMPEGCPLGAALCADRTVYLPWVSNCELGCAALCFHFSALSHIRRTRHSAGQTTLSPRLAATVHRAGAGRLLSLRGGQIVDRRSLEAAVAPVTTGALVTPTRTPLSLPVRTTGADDRGRHGVAERRGVPDQANGNPCGDGYTTGSHGVARYARRGHLRRLRQSAPLPGAGEGRSGDGGEVPGPKADQEGVAQRRRLDPAPVPVRDRDVL